MTKISISAIQLQGMDTLLGISPSDSSDANALDGIIQDLTSSQASSAPAASNAAASSDASASSTASSSTQSSSESTADQIASAEAATQAAEDQALFGISPNTSDPSIDLYA